MQLLRHDILAQATYGRLYFWLTVLFVIVVLGAIGAIWVRRWLSSEEVGSDEGFSLGELRRLHREGQLSDQEYEKARQAIVGTALLPRSSEKNRVD